MARRLRILSGLALFVFVSAHLLNVALGLHSIELMDRARPYLLGPWMNPVGSLVLTGSLGVHLVLGLLALYRRNTLRMSPSDAVQLAASLAIVPLLIPHVVGTAVAARYGLIPTYAGLIPYFWIDEPLEGLRQVLLLSVAWIHGCVGVYTWARIQRWWSRLGAFLYPLAVAIPVLALLGFVGAGNQALQQWQRPSATASEPVSPPGAGDVATPTELPVDEILAILKGINWTVLWAYLFVVAATLVARQVRLVGARHPVQVRFADGSSLVGETGLTLLEMARRRDLPIAQLCRGRGRCGTCRVRVLHASTPLAPRNEAEQHTLGRLGAGPDVRLACQLMPPAGTLRVERLLPPYVSPRELHAAAAMAAHEAGPSPGGETHPA